MLRFLKEKNSSNQNPFMRFRYSVYIFVAITLLVSCSGESEEEARKKENEQIEEHLKSPKLQFYKAIKIALRSTANVGKDPELDKARATMLKLGGEAISTAVTPDSARTISPFELLAIAGELYEAKDILTKKDEDELPTILGNIYYVFSNMQSSEVPEIAGFKYDNNFEHVTLGLLWTASMKAPVELPLYELHKADESRITYYDLKLLTQLSKALSYSRNHFPWHALDKSDEYLKNLEASKSKIVESPPFMVVEGEKNGEKTYYQLHVLGQVLKGLSESELEKEDESVRDYEIALDDAEKGGMDNELTWLVGSYVDIKKEDKDKALANLAKLEKSSLMSKPEKEAITEIKSYLESRENGKALNKLNDKIAMGTIVFNLLKKEAEEAKQLEKLKQSKEGKHFFELHSQLEQNSHYLDKVSSGLNTDSLGSKAKDLIKGLFDK